jgi:hypothetical protein
LSVLLAFAIITSGIAVSAQALGVSPVLLAIAVTPPVGSTAIGQSEQLTATGTYSDLNTQNLTDSVTWSSSNPTTATVNAQGLATGVADGAITITATDPSSKIPGTAALTVTPAVLIGIAVTPPADSVGIGQSDQYTATGLYSDLSTQNLTDSVTWSSSKSATATVSAQGLATGVADGAVTITATDAATPILGTAALTVGVSLSLLSMSPSSGKKRSSITFNGTGFEPTQTATVTYLSGRKKPKRAQSVLCTAAVALDGTFSCTGVIPRHGRAGKKGQKSIIGTDSGGTQATSTFTLL